MKQIWAGPGVATSSAVGQALLTFALSAPSPDAALARSFGRCFKVVLRVSLMSFCKSQFTHKSVMLFSMLVIVKDKLADLWGRWLVQNAGSGGAGHRGAAGGHVLDQAGPASEPRGNTR